jgi:uncharacterized protein YxjI
MDSVLKLAAKHANKIDPTIVKHLDKAGIKIPGAGATKKPSGSSVAHCSTPIPQSSPSDYTHFAPIAPHLATNQVTELNLKEKTLSFTGDDAKIKDSNGNVVFKVKADLISFSQSRKMTDSQGRTIALLSKKFALIGTTFYIGTEGNEKKVSMKRKNKYNPLNSNAVIKIDGQEVGEIKGDWRAKSFTITIDGKQIATVSRPRTMASTFMSADSYVIRITPKGQPVDPAFISLVVIALDELYHDE